MFDRPEVLALPPTRVRPLRAALILAVAALLAIVLPQVGNVYLNAVVCLIVFCCIAPAWYEWQMGRLDIFESIHVIGLLYFVYFGMGALWAAADPGKVAYDIYLEPYIPIAALYCLLGYIALLAGYFGPWFRGTPRTDASYHLRGVMFLVVPGMLGLIGSLAESAVQLTVRLGLSYLNMFSAMAQVASLFHFAWALAWLLLLSGRASEAQRWVMRLVLIPSTLLIILASMTDKSLAMTLAGIPLIALWYARRKVPWKTLLVLALILVFVLFPLYNTFRLLDPRIGWSDRVAVTYGVIRGWDLEEYESNSVLTVKRRLAMINSVAVVVRDVPRWVPYTNGETLFMPAIAFFIPRVFWPDKPYFAMGRRFAETFRVVHILDQDTRIAVTVPGELFWNFDLPGIVIGMLLWGVALRFLYRRYGEGTVMDPVKRAIHIVLLVQFVHFGGGLAGQLVTVVRSLVIIEAMCWVGRRAGFLDLVSLREVAGPTEAAQSEQA